MPTSDFRFPLSSLLRFRLETFSDGQLGRLFLKLGSPLRSLAAAVVVLWCLLLVADLASAPPLLVLPPLLLLPFLEAEVVLPH